MDLGLIGLGRMGLNMTIRLARGGHRVVVANRSPEPVATAAEHGAEAADSIEDLIARLDAPRAVWLMLPAGAITDQHVEEVGALLDPGDILINGANARYTDSERQAHQLAERGIHVLDAGVSGGIWGLEGGYSVMVGGEAEAVERLRPIFETLAPAADLGWGHVGPAGAGHFVKMVHNGIEYGMMQAMAEGFALMAAKTDWTGGEADLDLGQIARVWQHGSVVRSWLLDLTADVLEDRDRLDQFAPFVPDSGEGRWTVEEAIRLRVSTPVIAQSLFERFASRDEYGAAQRILSGMRGMFGGHAVRSFADPEATVDPVAGGIRTEGARTR